MNFGIYYIRCKDYFYIGSSVNFEARKYQHLYALIAGTHHNQVLQRLVAKHGIESVTITLEELFSDEKNMRAREQVLIDGHLNTAKCINLGPIVGSPAGIPVSEETKQKLSEIRRGSKHCRAIITEHDLLGMRLMFAYTTFSKTEIGNMFGFTTPSAAHMVTNYVHGRNWKHVPVTEQLAQDIIAAGKERQRLARFGRRKNNTVTQTDEIYIYALYSTGKLSQAEIAKQYNIQQARVSRIVRKIDLNIRKECHGI